MKKTHKSVHKPAKKQKPKKSKRFYLVVFAVVTIVLIVLTALYLTKIKKDMSQLIVRETLDFQYSCNKRESCNDCVIINCIQFEELGNTENGTDYAHFEATNFKTTDATCTAGLVVDMDGKILSNKTYPMGTLKPEETKRFKVLMTMPEGDSLLKISPKCE